MLVGQITNSNLIAQTPRTKNKLDENLESLVQSIKEMYNITSAVDSEQEQKLRFLLYSGLSWTADDVLKQAVEDGYKSEKQGVV